MISENGISEESAAYKSWWKVDQQVLSFLHSTISEAIIHVISKSISSKDAWTALEKHFNSKNASRIMDLQRQFYNFSKGNSITDDYVKSFKAIVESLAAVGQPVPEAAMIFAFLRGLGTDYENFVVSTNANIGHLGFEDIITNLKGHDAYLAYQKSLPSSLSSFPPMANISQVNNSSVKDQPRNSNGNSTKNYWYNNRGHGRGRQNRYPPRCQICSLFGHRARECREFISRMPQNAHGNTNSMASMPEAYSATSNGVHTVPVAPYNATGWYPDSGATHHITQDQRTIHQPVIYQGPDMVYVGNG